MRRLAILAAVLVTACKPSFDDRYDKAEKDIRTEASGVDSELAKQQPASPTPSVTPAVSPTSGTGLPTP